MPSSDTSWPELSWDAWHETADTLHLWTQVVGKVRMALAPPVNHWWHVPLYVTARGLTTSPIPHGAGAFEIRFDFADHALLIAADSGESERLALRPMAVADFHAEVMARLRKLGVTVRIWTMPNEIADAVPFERDRRHAQYDPDYAGRFWRVLLRSHCLMTAFRGRFLGKASPVHFFWGSFDLAVSRFSGRKAPPHPGVAPNLANWAMREAYSHEVSSCGFWPGNGGYGRAAFYSYAYPEPDGFASVPLRTAGAFYDDQLREFVLPYDAVRVAPDPDAALMGFFEETYAAAADSGGWDRAALERPQGAP
jgi:hypothetical protein